MQKEVLGPSSPDKVGGPQTRGKNAYADYLANIEFENIKNLWIRRAKVEYKHWEMHNKQAQQGSNQLNWWAFQDRFQNV